MVSLILTNGLGHLVHTSNFDDTVLTDAPGDSSSMRYGTRWRDQLEIVYCMARIYDLVRPDAYGAELRFINNAWPPGCMTTHDIRQTLESVKPRGVTMVGTSLRRKILEARVYNPVSEGERLERPILVCCFLDGCASHEPEEMLNDEILRCAEILAENGYPRAGR